MSCVWTTRLDSLFLIYEKLFTYCILKDRNLATVTLSIKVALNIGNCSFRAGIPVKQVSCSNIERKL